MIIRSVISLNYNLVGTFRKMYVYVDLNYSLFLTVIIVFLTFNLKIYVLFIALIIARENNLSMMVTARYVKEELFLLMNILVENIQVSFRFPYEFRNLMFLINISRNKSTLILLFSKSDIFFFLWNILSYFNILSYILSHFFKKLHLSFFVCTF